MDIHIHSKPADVRAVKVQTYYRRRNSKLVINLGLVLVQNQETEMSAVSKNCVCVRFRILRSSLSRSID